MRTLAFAMNLSVDGYVAAPGDDLGWSVPSDELFQWWSDRVAATGLALYGRRLWDEMGTDRVRRTLAGHAEGGVLLDDRRGGLERPPGHR